MTRICWWCVDIVSRMLDPDERDAVRGDFAESGETSGQALRGLLGLVLRRQTALWRNWRPWLALVGAVAPFGILLSLVSRRMAQSSAVTSWPYLNNWDWTYVRNTGFRLDFAHDVAVVLFEFLLLSCWSWTSGFVLGYLSRRAIWINGALFCLVLVTVELLGMPRFLGRSLFLSRADDFSPNSAVFAGAFYREVFPLIIHTVLVLLPSLWGMRQGLRLAALSVAAPDHALGVLSLGDDDARDAELGLVAGADLEQSTPATAGSSPVPGAPCGNWAARVHPRSHYRPALVR